jgi:hypothetical protein
MHDDGALHAWFIFNLHTRISFVFTQCTVNRYLHIYTMYRQLLSNPLQKITRNPDLLRGPVLAHGGDFPSTLVPCLVATAHPLTLVPFTPFPLLSPHTLFTTTTSTITVFVVRDSIVPNESYPLVPPGMWGLCVILFIKPRLFFTHTVYFVE